jgi:hypothetical protein
MAMITCPECKKKISETANSCPKCGYQLTPEKIAEIKKKEQQALKGCGIGCLSVIVIFVVLFLVLFDSGNKSRDEKSIESCLEYGVKKCKLPVTILGVSLVGRQLIVSVSIERTSAEAFFAAIGGIHGGIAEIKPDVDTVVIKDITGQRITVEMSKLLACYKKQISFEEFRDTWDIVNP